MKGKQVMFRRFFPVVVSGMMIFQSMGISTISQTVFAEEMQTNENLQEETPDVSVTPDESAIPDESVTEDESVTPDVPATENVSATADTTATPGEAELYVPESSIEVVMHLTTEKQVTVDDDQTNGTSSSGVEREAFVASDLTFYVALFEDPEMTKLISEIKPLKFENASTATTEFTGISLDKTYYVGEVNENGEVIAGGSVDNSGIDSGLVFLAEFENGNEVVATEEEETTIVAINNIFVPIPDSYYIEAHLTITQEVLGADGLPKNSDEVFYAGVFDDPDFETLSVHTETPIVELNLAGQSSVSKTIFVDVMPGESYELYVTEVTKDGIPVSDDSFAYVVSVDAESVRIDEANVDNSVIEASVTITNTEKAIDTDPIAEETARPTLTPAATATPTIAATATPTTAPLSNQENTVSNVPATGDETTVELYLILMLGALTAGSMILHQNYKKNNNK
jgi:hypothetical protein